MSTPTGTTVAARGAAVIVAAVAGAASFEHIASVAIGAGEQPWVGYSLPLAIDGLIVVGVSALLEDKRRQRQGRLSARLAVFVGVVATLAANIASAEPTWSARLVAITAPVSFLLSVEVLTRTGRRLSTPDDMTPQVQTTPAIPVLATPAAPDRPTNTTKPRTTAANRVAKAVAKTPDATAAQIAARLRVSERTVQRYWPRPPDDASPPPDDSRANSAARGAGLAPVPPTAFERPKSVARPNHRGATT
jgi:hypothetical protein